MRYEVVSCAPTRIAVTAKTAAGATVEADVDGVIVEMVPVDGGTRTITLDIPTPTDDERQAVLAAYARGSILLAKFEKE